MMRPLRALGVVLQKSVYDGGTRAALPASMIMGGRYRFYSSSVTRDSPIKTAPDRPRLVDMRFGQKVSAILMFLKFSSGSLLILTIT